MVFLVKNSSNTQASSEISNKKSCTMYTKWHVHVAYRKMVCCLLVIWLREHATYILDVLWGQPIKLIQVVSTSEFHEYWWNDFAFIFFVPLTCSTTSKNKYKHFGPKILISHWKMDILAGNALERVQREHKPADVWDITFRTRRSCLFTYQ
jgi:hypothetical protein